MLKKFKYLKQFRGENKQEPVSYDEVYKLLEGNFRNPDMALRALQKHGYLHMALSTLYAQEDKDA